jgi:hypothetical protein
MGETGMVTALLVLAAAAFVVVRVTHYYWVTEGLWPAVEMGAFMSVAGTAAAAVLMFFVSVPIGAVFGYDTPTENQRLVSLTDEHNAFGGHFFLGSGVIGSDPAYTFYTVEKGSARQLHQEKASDVNVFEDTTDPYVVWASDDCVSHHPLIVWCVPISHRRLLEIHVPSGSIKTGIDLGVKQ